MMPSRLQICDDQKFRIHFMCSLKLKIEVQLVTWCTLSLQLWLSGLCVRVSPCRIMGQICLRIVRPFDCFLQAIPGAELNVGMSRV